MDEPDEGVPIFGSWRRIYTAVVVCALVLMAMIAAFASWKY